MPPSFYMWSYAMNKWVALRDGDVAFAEELGFFVLWWPLENRPSKHEYNRIMDREFHLTANEADDPRDMRFRNIFKEG